MSPAHVMASLGLMEHPRVVPGVRGEAGAGVAVSENPATGEPIAGVRLDDAASYEREVAGAVDSFKAWRTVPAPVRGEVVRAISDELREHKAALGSLIALEVGKIRAEGLGEVQETIDIADFAVGLSRQLHGPTMPSERREHRLIE